MNAIKMPKVLLRGDSQPQEDSYQTLLISLLRGLAALQQQEKQGREQGVRSRGMAADGLEAERGKARSPAQPGDLAGAHQPDSQREQ